MTSLTTCSFVAVFVSALISVSAHYHNVIHLSYMNFDSEVRSAGFVFVVSSPDIFPNLNLTAPCLQEFHAGEHNPQLDDAARLLRDFSVAAVDGSDETNKGLLNKYHVTSLPSYKLFR